MAIDFPNSPSTNEIYTVGTKSWMYDGEKWNLLPLATTLDSLSDVTASSPSSGQFLKYNGTAWVNDTIDLATDTSGNYVSSLVAGTGVTLTNNSGEAATPTVAIGQSVGTTDTVIFGNVNVNEGSLFTTSIDGSTSIWNNITLYTDNGIVSVYGSLNATGEFIATGKATFNDPVTIQGIRESVIASSISTNVMTCNYNDGSIYYQSTNPSANFTVNVTNVPTDNNFAISMSVFVTQGATGYIPNAVQIDGVSQTIKWAGGSAPTPTSSSGKIDLFSFTLIRRSSAWTVLGSANLNF